MTQVGGGESAVYGLIIALSVVIIAMMICLSICSLKKYRKNKRELLKLSSKVEKDKDKDRENVSASVSQSNLESQSGLNVTDTT